MRGILAPVLADGYRRESLRPLLQVWKGDGKNMTTEERLREAVALLAREHQSRLGWWAGGHVRQMTPDAQWEAKEGCDVCAFLKAPIADATPAQDDGAETLVEVLVVRGVEGVCV